MSVRADTEGELKKRTLGTLQARPQEGHEAFTAALLLTEGSWKQAEVSKSGDGPRLPDGAKPGPRPSWVWPECADLFHERPLGWVSVDHLTSLSQFILFGPLFLLLLYSV